MSQIMSGCLLWLLTSMRLSKKGFNKICMTTTCFKMVNKCIQVLFVDIALSSSSMPTVLQRLQFSLLFKVASLFWHQFLFGSHWAASCLISKDDVTASGILGGRCKTREGKEWDRTWWWALMFLRSFYHDIRLNILILWLKKCWPWQTRKPGVTVNIQKTAQLNFVKLLKNDIIKLRYKVNEF